MWRAPPDIGLMGSASEQVFCVTVLAKKMASNRKTFNMKVVSLVETIDFDIKIIPIRGSMQKLEHTQHDPSVSKI